MGRIRKMIGAFVHAPDRFDMLAERVADANERTYGVEKALYGIGGALSEVSGAEGSFVQKVVRQICEDRDSLAALNGALHGVPTICGDPSRLRLAPTAAVQSCLFNTVSGSISVGEYAFAADGVRIITERHDPELTGLPLQEAVRNRGCDIAIGESVYLGERVLLLGPCTVEDRAILQAGAVVAPGTRIPAGEIWGGNPARRIAEAKAETGENTGQEALRSALTQCGGILFLEGWSARIRDMWDVPAHQLLEERGTLLVNQARWRLCYRKERHQPETLEIRGPGGMLRVPLEESEGETEVEFPTGGGDAELSLRFSTEEKLRIVLLPVEEPDRP